MHKTTHGDCGDIEMEDGIGLELHIKTTQRYPYQDIR